MQKVQTFLWFNKDAAKAAKFYVSIFKNAKIVGKLNHNMFSSVMFRIGNQEIVAFNGGPHYKLTPAVSLFVEVKTQKEVDYYWTRLLKNGGKESMCGWLTDQFGVSWQVVPKALGSLIGGENEEGAQRAMAAMMKMKKLDLQVLQDAYKGKRIGKPKAKAKSKRNY